MWRPEGRDDPAVARVLERLYARGGRVFDLGPGVIERVADTVTPQPIVSVVAFEPSALESVEEAAALMVCVDVRDPGNLGTMIRTAECAGVDGVVCCEGTVDPTNPKCLRASAGSVFRVPVVTAGSPDEVLGRLGSVRIGPGRDRRARGDRLRGLRLRRRIALTFGNESSGLGQEVSPLIDTWVSIPMAGGADSLNVSVSAAVICFERLRQHRLSEDSASRSTMPAMETPDDRRVREGEGPT